MKQIGFLKMAVLLAPLCASLACSSASDPEATGDGDGDSAGDGDGDGGDGDTGDGDGTGGGMVMGDGDGDGSGGIGDGDGTGGGGVSNPYKPDWDLLANQATDHANLDQCMGYLDKDAGTYRSYGVDDPNPKDGDPCPGTGNTSSLDGSCNVPAGFERAGEAIGNKACTCDAALGLDCSVTPLPGVTFGAPTACDDSLGLGPKGTYAELIDEQPCGDGVAEFDTCMSPDLPASDGTCEWTTPKGCVCLADAAGALIWQCASTNSWFDCAGDSCPWDAADIQSGADIKTNCNSCGAPSCQ